MFFELDREGEGYVTLEDFKHALQEHYPHQVASEEMIRLFNAVDTDHCGRIYYSDFLATMLQFRLRVHDSLLRHTFNQLDVDRQGLITVENLRTILGKTFEGEQTEECMREVKGSNTCSTLVGLFWHYEMRHILKIGFIGLVPAVIMVSSSSRRGQSDRRPALHGGFLDVFLAPFR